VHRILGDPSPYSNISAALGRGPKRGGIMPPVQLAAARESAHCQNDHADASAIS
jgi:hypothetical protein